MELNLLFEVDLFAEEHRLCPPLDRSALYGWRGISCKPCRTSILVAIDPDPPPVTPEGPNRDQALSVDRNEPARLPEGAPA